MTNIRITKLLSVLLFSFASLAYADERASSGNYFLGPEDVLEISVWKEEDLVREVLVRPDGYFSFPLVGEVLAQGRTPQQIQRIIELKVGKFIPDPVVTVLVKKVAAYRIYVLGQVKKPGQFPVGRYVNVMQALAMAGGLTAFASEDNINIIRTIDGRQRTIRFEYGSLKDGRNLEQNIRLQAGDVIVVP